MIGKLDEAFRFQRQALELRSFRQQLLASNIANADTPGYKARDIDFGGALQAALAQRPGGAAQAGNANAAQPVQQVLYRTPAQPSVDGNTVEMDAERAQFVDNSVKLEASLTFLNGQIKALLSAIQG